ncbi:hypothetical protein BHM03_00032620 [Ensete ventricosum]|nr:hypothetical protein BHM03_00032620 [Ensete ventricosum]
MDLEASRQPTGLEDIFVGFHAKDNVQCTYAGSVFHKFRNYYVSSKKRNVSHHFQPRCQELRHISPHLHDESSQDVLVYWSSSKCYQHRTELAERFFAHISHHSFGSCLNNVGGRDAAVSFYPECRMELTAEPRWWDHLHCAMSQYKFVLAIENTMAESYVTEKLYYALDAGSVPVYFGAPDVESFVPPHSVIDGSKFRSVEELATYVKAVADDPVAYSEYHAWRRCGVMGYYGRNRAASLDTLPCRLCEYVSRKGGRDAASYRMPR